MGSFYLRTPEKRNPRRILSAAHIEGVDFALKLGFSCAPRQNEHESARIERPRSEARNDAERDREQVSVERDPAAIAKHFR